MKFGKLLFFFCLPALIWNAPLISSTPPQKRASFSPWDLLKFENLSYDNITSFVETIEYGNPSQLFNESEAYEILSFVTFLARNGISSWNTEAQEELEKDIEWLFSDEDEDSATPWWSLSSWTSKEISIIPTVFQSNEKLQIIQCKSWFSKKWDKTKKFVKKHKKPIIIAAAVVVVATVVIVATGGTAAAPIAGAAAAAGAASSNSSNEEDHPHINKPGDVRVQDDTPPQETNQKDSSLTNNHPVISSNANQSTPLCPQVEPLGSWDKETLSKTIQHHSEVIKETLSEELPNEALNIPPNEAPTFWENAAQTTKEVTSWIAHDALKDTAEWVGISNETSHEYHEKIDEIFGTDYAAKYAPEALEKEPKIVKGVIPPPGGNLPATTGKVVAIARSSGVIAGAAVGSAITKVSPPPPLSQPPTNERYVDTRLPQDPDSLLKDSRWKEISHPDAREQGHRSFENQETGEKLRYDEGKPGQPGHKGQSHWHRYNPNSQMGKKDEYLNAKDSPVAKDSPESHLYPPTPEQK